MAKGKGTMPMMDAKWQVESDMRTLLDAEEIKKDPKRMRAVQEMAKEKLASMEKLTSEKE